MIQRGKIQNIENAVCFRFLELWILNLFRISDFGFRIFRPTMAFADLPEQQDAVRLLQRSLERGRLGHAYLFSGNDLSNWKRLRARSPRRSIARAPRAARPQACRWIAATDA